MRKKANDVEGKNALMKLLLRLCLIESENLSYSTLSSLIRALVLSILLLLVRLPQAHAEEWTEWRGGRQEGRSTSSTPLLHWSKSQNVAWKTPIPGNGYSSPIVTKNAVYVSAAWNADSDVRLRLAVQSILYINLLFVAVPLCVSIFRCCRSKMPDAPRLAELFRLAGYGVMIVLLGALIFYGESLLDFHRAVERGWIAACLCGVLSLRLSGFAAAPRSHVMLTAGIALIGFAALLGATIPDRQHTVAADPHSDVSVLIYLTIALPLLVGLSLVTRYARHTLIYKKENPAGAVSPRLRVFDFLLRGLPVVLALATALLLFKLIRAQTSGTEATISVGVVYEPHLPLGAICVPFFVLTALLLWRWLRSGSVGNNLGIVVCSALFLLTGLFALVERLIVHVTYLAYLLGQPVITPLLSKKAVILFVSLCSLAVLVDWRRTRHNPRFDAPALLVPFRFAAYLLPLIYLGYANYLPKEPRLERGIVCVDRQTGAIQWKCGGLFALGETMHSDNSPATPTPATDGERIYAWFGTPGLLCTNTKGERLWLNTELPYKTREGVASSPILCQGKVIILSESDAGNFLAAIDGITGKTAWRTIRTKKQHSFAGNCRTPNIVRIAGQEVIVVWGYEDVSGYDPKTGRELWSHPVEEVGTGGNPVASAVSEGNLLFLFGPYQASCLDLARQGDTDKLLRWKTRSDDGAQCPSPVLSKGLLFAVSDNGSAYCLDAVTGKELWRKDLEQQHYASVIALGDAVYFCGTQGLTTVVACDRTFRLLAQNDLNEPTYASFAPADNTLFVRTRQNLYCLRAP